MVRFLGGRGEVHLWFTDIIDFKIHLPLYDTPLIIEVEHEGVERNSRLKLPLNIHKPSLARSC